MEEIQKNALSWAENFYTTINIQTILLLTIITLLIHRYQTSRNLPPGPWGIPILGVLPFISNNDPHKSFVKWCKKYGNIISFYIGSVLVVVLGDYKSIKEAFVRQGFLFSGIPPNSAFKNKPTDKGLGLSEGEVAMKQRKFILSTMRHFGLGKTNLELQIMDEMKHLMSEIRKSNNQPIDFKNTLAMSVSNIIFLFEFGKRYDYSDPELIYFLKILDKTNSFAGAVTLTIFLPWTKYIPFLDHITGTKMLSKVLDEIQNYFKKKIQEVEKSYTEGNKTNYTDSFFTERLAMIKRNGAEEEFNSDELLGNLLLLYAAGTQTVSYTITWCLLYLLKYPDILNKVQKEIDDVIGHDRTPCASDKNNMSFTEATILEVQRHVSVLALNIPHSNMEKTTLFDCLIPKRSYIIANIYAVHHDEALWGDPENFRPERFLNEEGRVTKPEYFMPFSIGKRNCIGEPLAQIELFLYFTSILQQFHFNLPEDDTLSFDYEFGVALCPKLSKLCFSQR